MLYTEDFTMRHYVGFSQIGSHIITNKIKQTCDKKTFVQASKVVDKPLKVIN